MSALSVLDGQIRQVSNYRTRSRHAMVHDSQPTSTKQENAQQRIRNEIMMTMNEETRRNQYYLTFARLVC